MMSSRVLKEGDDEKGFALTVHTTFNRFKARYARWLDITLAARPLVLAVWIIASLLCIPLFMQSSSELAPQEDQGGIFGSVEDSANINLDQAGFYADEAERIFSKPEEADFVFQIISPGATFGGLVLTPWDQRERKVFDVLRDVETELASIPGINMFPITPSASRRG